jgi:hypothetical protein
LPISNTDFNRGVLNSPILDFLKSNPNEAYSLAELKKEFGEHLLAEIEMLTISQYIDIKRIKSVYYLRLKR